MSRRSLFRLGMFQLAAGAVSVLLLGVLNRILRVEMGLDLLLVGLVVGGGHYLGALVAIPFGYYSDRRPLFGFHRTVYILLGVIFVALALAVSPLVAKQLALNTGPFWVTAAFLFFFAEGVGTYVAGTAYLALITDRTDEAERGRAVAFIWTLLMVGILTGVLFTVVVIREYSFDTLRTAFAGAAIGVLVLSFVALWRQESRVHELSHDRPTTSLRESILLLLSSRQTRTFFAFLVVGLFATFMQDIVLEPFGGEVLGLSVRGTAMFNAYLMVGLIGAMWLGGVRLMPRFGKSRVTTTGAWVEAAGFLLLALSSWIQQAWLAPPAILVLGVGMGFFTVGSVSLMMDMTRTGQTGLFVGAWTLASALARGPASIAGGGIHNAMRALGGEAALAYAAVFVAAALGMALAVWLLNRVGLPRFRREVADLSAVLSQAAD